jgi:putative RNA 2'-phosphotransferase
VDRAREVRLSKLLSFALRHGPSEVGISLDTAGWTSVDQLLAALAARGEALTRTELEAIVRSSDKQRFALSPDGARIRANQGHSVDVDLALPPKTPPEQLYHGTIDRFIPAIRTEGLIRGSRMHVHLSADLETAQKVASRRRGRPIFLTVRAAEMHRDGHTFFLSENGVWLTVHVPAQYLGGWPS